MPIDIVIKDAITFTVNHGLHQKVLNFRRANFSALNNYFVTVNWSHQFSALSNLDDIVDKFYDTLINY